LDNITEIYNGLIKELQACTPNRAVEIHKKLEQVRIEYFDPLVTDKLIKETYLRT
jgi:hypothetical protein